MGDEGDAAGTARYGKEWRRLGVSLVGPLPPCQRLWRMYVHPRLPFPLTVSQV